MRTTLFTLNASTRGGILVLTLFCTAACSDPSLPNPVSQEALAKPSKAEPPRPPKIAVPMDELHFHDPADLFADAKLPLDLKPKTLAQPPKFRCTRVPPSVHTTKRRPIKKLARALPHARPCGRST